MVEIENNTNKDPDKDFGWKFLMTIIIGTIITGILIIVIAIAADDRSMALIDGKIDYFQIIGYDKSTGSYIMYDTTTKVMYSESKYKLVVLINADGTPKLYDESIEINIEE